MSRYDRDGGRPTGPTRLYVGRLSSRTRTRDLEDLFMKYGRVRDVDLKHDFAFIEFYDSRDADDARHYLNGKEVDGSRLVVEFTRRGPRGPGGAREYLGRGPPPGTGRCYNCGKDGHWARDCRAGDWRDKCYRCGRNGHIERNCRNSPRGKYAEGRRSLSRSRSPRGKSYSRSPSRSRSRSRSYRSPSPVRRRGFRSPSYDWRDCDQSPSGNGYRFGYRRGPSPDGRRVSKSPSPEGKRSRRSPSPDKRRSRRSPSENDLEEFGSRSRSYSPRGSQSPLGSDRKNLGNEDDEREKERDEDDEKERNDDDEKERYEDDVKERDEDDEKKRDEDLEKERDEDLEKERDEDPEKERDEDDEKERDEYYSRRKEENSDCDRQRLDKKDEEDEEDQGPLTKNLTQDEDDQEIEGDDS